jgi:hypothetical protein
VTPIQAGSLWPIEVLITNAAGTRVTGLSSGNIVCDIRCTTPGGADVGKFWDFGGGGFKSSTWITRRAPLAEVDSTNAPGVYSFASGWNTTGIAGTFLLVYEQTVPIDTTSLPATDDVLVIAASTAATAADVIAARDAITSVLVSSTGTVLAGSTTSNVRTTISASNITYNNMLLLVINAAGTVPRKISSYSATNGAFTLASTLPFIPLPGDVVLVLNQLAWASVGDAMTVANGGISSTAFAAGAIDNAAVADNFITAAKVATDTIGAPQLASSASTKIASSVAGTVVPGSFGAGTLGYAIGTNLDALVSSRLAAASYATPPTASANAAAVWQTAVPGAFTSGQAGYVLGTNLDALVSTRMASGAYTTPPTASVIATAVWDDLTSLHGTSGSFGVLVKTNLDAAVSTRLATTSYAAAPSAAAISTQIWSETIPGAFSPGAAGNILGTNLDAAVSSRSTLTAASVWSTPLPGVFLVGSSGYLIGNNLDSTVSSRAATGAAMSLIDDAITSAKIATDAIGAGQLSAAGVTKIATGVGALAVPGVFSAGTLGNRIGNNLDVAVGTRLSTASYVVPPTAAANAAAAWAVSIPGTYISGQAGFVLGTNLDALVSTRATVAEIISDGTPFNGANLDVPVSSRAVAGDAMTLTVPERSAIQSAMWTTGTRTLTGIGVSGIASQATVDTVSAAIAAALGAGFTVGQDDLHSLHALVAVLPTTAAPTAAANASAVWSTAVPGAFAQGTAGARLDINVNAAAAVAAVATWNELTAVHTTVGSFGELTKASMARVDATVSSRAVPGDPMTLTSGERAASATSVWGSITRTLTGIGASGLSSQASVDALPSAAEAAAAIWSEALPGTYLTGSAGALMALAGASAPPSASAVATAVWGHTEGTPSVGSFGYGLKLLRMLTTNRMEELPGNPGSATLYNDDASSVYLTWTLRDGTGAAITLTAGEPARRSAGA